MQYPGKGKFPVWVQSSAQVTLFCVVGANATSSVTKTSFAVGFFVEAAVCLVMLHAPLRSCCGGLIPRDDDDVDGMNAITPLCRAI